LADLLSDYQQTVQDFIALLQALRAWRKVIHLYYQGRMIGRLTVNFAELMKKSSTPKITLVDHFDDDPNIAVWRKSNAPPAPVAGDPIPADADREPPTAAPPPTRHRAFPPDPAKPSQPIDWAPLYGTPWDFSDPESPLRGILSPEEVVAGLTALEPILAGSLPPLPVWHAGFADLFEPLPLPDAMIVPDKLSQAMNALAALDNSIASEIEAPPESDGFTAPQTLPQAFGGQVQSEELPPLPGFSNPNAIDFGQLPRVAAPGFGNPRTPLSFLAGETAAFIPQPLITTKIAGGVRNQYIDGFIDLYDNGENSAFTAANLPANVPLQPGAADAIIEHQGYLTKNDPNSAELALLNAYTQQANAGVQAGDHATIRAIG
jgi:hypothetical protein